MIFVSNATMFLHEAWSWKSFAPNYPARKTSAGTESSFRESRRCRKIVKTQGPRFLGATINIYQLCLDTFHGHVFVFSSFFFSPSFLSFVRPTTMSFAAICFLENPRGNGKKRRVHYSVPVLETVEIGRSRRKRKTVYGNRGFVCSLEILPVVPVSAKRDLWTEQRRRWSVGKKRKTAREIPSCAGSK